MMIKHCNTCGEDRPVEKFGYRAASRDGLAAKCKTCMKVYDKARAKDPMREEARRVYAQTDEGKLASNKAKAAYIKRNPTKAKAKAHVIAGRAIRAGNLARMPCEKCKSTKDIHAHHDDYEKALNIRWLCPGCHNKWHKKNGPGLNA